MTARGALCGLALALGAAGAAAGDDSYAAGGDCVERFRESATAMRAEFPGFGRYFGALEMSEVCALADLMAAMVDANRRGDEAALDELKERFAESEREREERRQRAIDWLFGQ